MEVSSKCSNKVNLDCGLPYLVTQENLNILRKLNREVKDATSHCISLSAYRKGIIHKINSRLNQSSKVIHSVK